MCADEIGEKQHGAFEHADQMKIFDPAVATDLVSHGSDAVAQGFCGNERIDRRHGDRG